FARTALRPSASPGGVREPTSQGAVPNSSERWTGKAFWSRSPRRWKQQLSPTATACQRRRRSGPGGSTTTPRTVAKAPCWAFVSRIPGQRPVAHSRPPALLLRRQPLGPLVGRRGRLHEPLHQQARPRAGKGAFRGAVGQGKPAALHVGGAGVFVLLGRVAVL